MRFLLILLLVASPAYATFTEAERELGKVMQSSSMQGLLRDAADRKQRKINQALMIGAPFVVALGIGGFILYRKKNTQICSHCTARISVKANVCNKCGRDVA